MTIIPQASYSKADLHNSNQSHFLIIFEYRFRVSLQSQTQQKLTLYRKIISKILNYCFE